MIIKPVAWIHGCAAVLLLGCPLRAAWVPLGPFGGAASIVVGDPLSSKTFVAGTRNGLLFRTGDAGETWTPLPFPAQLHATLNTLVIDPQTQGVYLAGLSSDLPQYSGILRSTDAGATWRQVPDLRDQQVRALAFKRANSKIVAAGTESGVFLSQDNGVTWSRISPIENSQLCPIVSLAFDAKDSDTLYAGTPHLPWKTSDAGLSWHSIPEGMLDDSDVFSLQVDRNRPQRVFASACSGIYRSLDGGATWTRMTGAKDASYRTYVIVQDPQYENVWFAGTTDGMVRSLDGGTTWERLTPFTTRSIAFDLGRLGRIFIATDQAGILRSQDNGKTWQPINHGFCNRRLFSLWTTEQAVYTAAGDGPTGGRVFRLSKGSRGWDKVAPPPRTAAVPRHVTPSSWPSGFIDVVSSRGRLLAATSAGLKASDDLGVSWDPVRGELETDSIQAICRHPVRPEVLFVAKYAVIFSSSDAGRSWTRISHQPLAVSSVRKLILVPGLPDRILVLTPQQGVWMLPLETNPP